jgi:hypothetical protein
MGPGSSRAHPTSYTVDAVGCSQRCRVLGLMLTGQVNLLKPTGYEIHQQVEYFNNFTFCLHCIYVFFVCLKTNSNLCLLHKKTNCFYNRDENVYSAVRTGPLNESICAKSFKG